MENRVAVDRRSMEGTIDPEPAASSCGGYVAIEVKRKAGIDAVEQLTRYLHFLNRDPRTSPCRGIIASTSITPQAVTLAADRGIGCLVVDYEDLKGTPSSELTLF